MSDKAKTVKDVIAQFAEAEEINPLWERVTVFSWSDMLLLKNSIAKLEAQLRQCRSDKAAAYAELSGGDPAEEQP